MPTYPQYEENSFAGVFQYKNCWKNMIDGVPLTRGHTPYFIFGSNILFLAVIHLLDIAYFSE